MTKEYTLRNKGNGFLYERFPSEEALREHYRNIIPDTHEIVTRNVEDWKVYVPPIDYSCSPEEAADMLYVLGEHIDGYVTHAFKLGDEGREAIIRNGFGRYYGARAGLQGRRNPVPLCGKIGGKWNTRILIRRGTFSDLPEDRDVCQTCIRSVGKLVPGE